MYRLILAIQIIFMALGCSNKYSIYQSQYQFTSANSIPDYNNSGYWAAHPWKKDPSDSIPTEIGNKTQDSLADVFFIYPTTYTQKKKDWTADIHDSELNAKTDYSTILYQASVFNQHCRVFAPRYRQAHLSAFFTNSPDVSRTFDTAYSDVKKAFELYLQYYNHNRPIIIAGHSQGAKMAERLLKEFFDGKPLQKQLVAAYIIGWPAPEGYFDSLPICQTPSQTGCFCSWRTFRTNYIPEYIKEEKPVALVTNPLTWTTSLDYVNATENKGSVLRDFRKVIPYTTGAQIHKGVLWIDKPRFPGGTFFLTRNYHIADINLFYINIRENIEERIRAYLK